MLTPFIRRQLWLFLVLTVVSLLVLGIYYLQVPSLMGIGRYSLKAQLPASGGLYPTANVTYRGITIGKVTDVEPTEHGAEATMSIDSQYKIPVDAIANVHSVSAVGEQYLDLVSTGNPGKYLADGQTISKGTVPAEIGPALDTANRGLEALPRDKIGKLLDETAESVGGLGPALQRLVDSTQAIVGDFRTNITNVNDIIQNSGGVLDSQVKSGDAIERWARNLNTLASQAAARDSNVKSVLSQAAPTADQVNEVFSDVRESLPQTLANLEVVFDLLKRYHTGLEQVLVFLPQGASIAQTVAAPFPNQAALDLALSINQPPPCLTGFIPAPDWRSPADTSIQPLPSGTYCKIPMDTPANSVRGSRNIPCTDIPGKRAATPRECRDPNPYVPAGTNPWFGDPNQILTCPAPGARCDQSVRPGMVIPAPSINNGMNPAPSDRVAGTPPATSDPLTRPGSGTVQCNGQQPNPCVYTPTGPPSAVYSPQSGELVGPDGVKYSVENSTKTGDDGWKEMLAPAS
ncbi:MCE family protein [Mycobacterium montefiorense]|uniref:Mammalian cell entry protein n=1 Tax=Mycobacterium montefiorense TaxID=154654 RepID=A0AA37URP9_9MYCO|nr:MlaD family protein [Mycobacterium montefiorense]GBG37971.1 mammalian cell entry protein [Mycobacterium montefiorense]GKU33880.1 mammalian cell entry protein [Mycobacterium montefiorense]GKU41341.1 mammalian cell entry protein [Mycobacterium montefiorense]GKU46251.1 mammalian cell entry protein [Mycobacterium montefiorense]GKU52408.1 mammalian cell entry protein [Mycobacterium montefiorense]